MRTAESTRQEIRDRYLNGDITLAEADHELALVAAIERKPRLVKSQTVAYKRVLSR